MSYGIVISETAENDLTGLKHNEPQAYRKAMRLIEELSMHPDSGTGKPERLKGDKSGLWSRRITDRHRLVYKIEGEELIVYIITASNHYQK